MNVLNNIVDIYINSSYVPILECRVQYPEFWIDLTQRFFRKSRMNLLQIRPTTLRKYFVKLTSSLHWIVVVYLLYYKCLFYYQTIILHISIIHCCSSNFKIGIKIPEKQLLYPWPQIWFRWAFTEINIICGPRKTYLNTHFFQRV